MWDIVWVIFLVAVYYYIVRPFALGFKQVNKASQSVTNQKKKIKPIDTSQHYVDYEEIK